MLTGYKRRAIQLDLATHRIVQRHTLDAIPYPDVPRLRSFDAWDMSPFIYQDDTRMDETTRIGDITSQEMDNLVTVMFQNKVITLN